MSQIRGSCGHVKASWDNHATCFSCSRCSFETRCSTCKEWTSAIWTLVAKRRTSMGRKKSTEDKKKWDMGAPGTLETVSLTVEGSSDNRHTGSGASVGKSQSETLSQSEKSLGEKYRDNRENLLSDTLWYKGATPDRSSSLATPVSTDLRVDTSPVPSGHRFTGHQSNGHPGTGHQSTRQPDTGHRLTRQPGAGHQSTRHWSFTRSPDIRSPGIQAKGYQSNESPEIDVDLVHGSTSYRSTGHQSTGQTGTSQPLESQPGTSRSYTRSRKRDYRSSPRRHRSRSNHRSSRSRHHRHYSSSLSHSGSSSRSRSKSSSYSSYRTNSSDSEGRHKRKRSHRHRSISGHRHSKRHRHSSVSRHRK